MDGRPRILTMGRMGAGVTGKGSVFQSEVLSEHLRRDGYLVRSTSSATSRVGRLLDAPLCASAWAPSTDIGLVEVYSGPGFLQADVATQVLRRHAVPSILVLHGGNLPEFSKQHPGWVKRVLARGAALVSPSPYLARAFSPRPVQIIPNLLQVDYPFHPRKVLTPRILWMRSFHDLYNPELAVRTLAELLPRRPEARLTMAGSDAGTLSSVRQLAASLGIAHAVSFPGFLDARGKREAFASHDVFLNTNRVDNTPVAVVEAMASGVPVVATRVGGIADLITHETTGLLSPSDDALSASSAIERLLTEPALVERLSQEGRRKAAEFSWEHVGPLWTALFQQLIHAQAHDSLRA